MLGPGTVPVASTSDAPTPPAPAPARKPVNAPADLAMLNTISVTGGDATKSPTVTFAKKPISVKATTVKVLRPGTGPQSTPTSEVSIHEALYQGTTGAKKDDTYGAAPQAFVLSSTETIPGLIAGLTGVRTGSRILMAIPPADAFGAAGNSAAGFGATDNLVLVADIGAITTPLQQAQGKAVAPVAGQPTVAVDASNVPVITVPKACAPTSLVGQPLIEGTGAVVKKGETITVNYSGVLWATGATFDSSFARRSPASFAIGDGAVIPGWDKTLVGKKVGSRVLLVVPPVDGYAAQAKGGIPANSTLVFVVDILAAA